MLFHLVIALTISRKAEKQLELCAHIYPVALNTCQAMIKSGTVPESTFDETQYCKGGEWPTETVV